eukprot:m.736560 g.736560  ORF g.736560 m.736560 type:complete len:63 (-) comp23095_c0_seq45:1943-2131(-)
MLNTVPLYHTEHFYTANCMYALDDTFLVAAVHCVDLCIPFGKQQDTFANFSLNRDVACTLSG